MQDVRLNNPLEFNICLSDKSRLMEKCKISLSSQCFIMRENNFTDRLLKDTSILAGVPVQLRAGSRNSEVYNEHREAVARSKCFNHFASGKPRHGKNSIL